MPCPLPSHPPPATRHQLLPLQLTGNCWHRDALHQRSCPAYPPSDLAALLPLARRVQCVLRVCRWQEGTTSTSNQAPHAHIMQSKADAWYQSNLTPTPPLSESTSYLECTTANACLLPCCPLPCTSLVASPLSRTRNTEEAGTGRTEPRPGLLASAVLEESRHHGHLALLARTLQVTIGGPGWAGGTGIFNTSAFSRGRGFTCWGAATVRRRLAVRRALERGAICTPHPP